MAQAKYEELSGQVVMCDAGHFVRLGQGDDCPACRTGTPGPQRTRPRVVRGSKSPSALDEA